MCLFKLIFSMSHYQSHFGNWGLSYWSRLILGIDCVVFLENFWDFWSFLRVFFTFMGDWIYVGKSGWKKGYSGISWGSGWGEWSDNVVSVLPPSQKFFSYSPFSSLIPKLLTEHPMCWRYSTIIMNLEILTYNLFTFLGNYAHPTLRRIRRELDLTHGNFVF